MKLKYLIFLLFMPALVYPQSAKDLLVKLQGKYKSVKSFTADFSQSTKAETGKDEFTSSGRIYFKKKDKFKIEFKDQILVTDGATVWNYNRKQNKVIITGFDNGPSVLSLDKFILEYPNECEASFAGEGDKIIVLKPKDKDADFREIRITPDESTILSKVEFTDANGNYFSFRFTNVKLNENLSDKLFKYTVPKGTRTVDLR